MQPFTAVFLVISLLPSAVQQIAARDNQTSHASASYSLALRWGLIAAVTLGILGQLAASTFQLPSLWLLALAVLMPGYALLGALRGQQQARSSALLVSQPSNLFKSSFNQRRSTCHT